MNEREQIRRQEVVAEARSWIGTPYVIRGRIKGAGCDCGSLLMSIAVNSGLMTDEELEVYSLDCWAHWSDEKYLKRVMRYAERVMSGVAYRSTVVLPGSLVLVRVTGSRHFNHGGFVTEWPKVVHGVNPEVEEADASSHWMWGYKEIEIFDFKRLIDPERGQ